MRSKNISKTEPLQWYFSRILEGILKNLELSLPKFQSLELVISKEQLLVAASIHLTHI